MRPSPEFHDCPQAKMRGLPNQRKVPDYKDDYIIKHLQNGCKDIL